VWGRRHQYVNLSFLGIFTFTAPYLPWVLLAFSVMLGSSPLVDLLGMVAGERATPLEGVPWAAQHGAVPLYALFLRLAGMSCGAPLAAAPTRQRLLHSCREEAHAGLR
jgi:hypothetical protein